MSYNEDWLEDIMESRREMVRKKMSDVSPRICVMVELFCR